MFDGVYDGRRVLVTGHTGFKGSWLAAWLLELGADVAGFAVDVPTNPSHFETIGLANSVLHYAGDVRDLECLRSVFRDFRPEIVMHLAAQALVRRSYADPAGTFAINTLGTVHVLEALRTDPSVQAAVFVTSDKAYRNVEWPWGYRETDTLGGEDPYGGSKGCAELAFYSYYHSFFEHGDGPQIATARAGNVIGGGDWAEGRIVPDCVRAWSRSEAVTLRNPHATRPWQHVLEPLSGYLWLGAKLWSRDAAAVGSSYNFGPPPTVEVPVERLVRQMAEQWPGAEWHVDSSAAKQPEATLLKLSCDRALVELRWSVSLSFDETVRFTAEWYRAYYREGAVEAEQRTAAQIAEYAALASQRGAPWAS
ncbi:MAG: CDP-glucose 4,6-dehydratase [Candidatus Binatia bacterium]